MSTANKLTYLNTTKSAIKSAINLTGANITNEPFRQYIDKLYDAFINIINNGTGSLYNNLPKVTGTGSQLTLSNTASAPMKMNLSASDSTNDIKVVTGDNSIKVSNEDLTQEQTFPLTLGSLELAKIDDYKDVIFQNTTDSEYYDSSLVADAWYKKEKLGKKVFDGTENWTIETTGGGYRFGLEIPNIVANSSNDNIPSVLCNNFDAITPSATWTGNKGISINTTGKLYIVHDSADAINTLAKHKQWLEDNQTIVYFPIVTPDFIRIADTTLVSQLNNMKNATSYDDETNISQVNDYMPFIINAIAIKNSMN